MHRKIIGLVIVTSFGLIGLANGCSADQWNGANEVCCPTDPKDVRWDDPICVEGRQWLAYMKDAGIDGAGCSPPMWPSGKPESDEAVESVCVPNAPDNFKPPQPLWVGPKEEDPGCVPEVGAFGDRRYNDLDVPYPSCPVCVCGDIKGSCSPRPNSIHVRADFCEVAQTYTTDFSGPENWDGSCTSINAIPAGAECPAGSGMPCAQSIYTSALPDPVEGCEPISWPVPKLYSDWITWKTTALSCNATPIDLVCPEHDSTRFAVLPKGWRHCVRHEDNGIHECPSGSQYKDQVIAYADKGYKDTRHCTECGCKAGGGTCYGTFNVYEDEQCTKFVNMATLFSDTYECSNVPAGVAIGSKELVDMMYMPGKCEPTGGVPIGSVEKDDAGAVTWCCM